MTFRGTINEDIRDSTPDWAPYRSAQAPAGAPNVVYLLWDDTGIATWDCYGGLVEMPNMARLANSGVRLTQFHTTALCSPTRAALLTGRNPTSVGVASVLNMAEGFPGLNGRIPADTALLPEILSERGWSTYAVGKWHLTPLEDCHAAGSREYWPLRRGFDRFYGFLNGMTDQWYPTLVSDNRPIDPPSTPERGYHLSQDLADNAIGFLRDHRAAAPDKPWFLYLCPGAGHSPHQVATEWADRYRGTFDMGYERYRDIVLNRQKELGLLPPDTELSPINPYADRTSPDGVPWPQTDTVRPWETLSEDEKRVSCRMAEVFAGFLSYTDAQIGRLLDYLEESGQLDNTIVVVTSDNGASGEGGPDGAVDELARVRGVVHTTETALQMFDELGGPATQMNYPIGWAMAFNTPYKLFKRYASHEGGTADPFIIAWPNGLGSAGEVRDHYTHVSDVTLTIYDLLGIEAPAVVKGIEQRKLEGVSFSGALRDPHRDTGKNTQFYSMMGTRGIWHQGWFANTVHPPTSAAPRGWSNFGHDQWELFHIDSDRSQMHDLAATHPGKLDELKAIWQQKAVEYQAYPLNDLSIFEIIGRGGSIGSSTQSGGTVFYPGTPATVTPTKGLIRGRTFTLTAALRLDRDDTEGVLYSQGQRSVGQALFLAGGYLHYVCTTAGHPQRITSAEPVPLGAHAVGVRFTRRSVVEGTVDVFGDATLFVDEHEVGSLDGLRMTGADIMQTISVGRSVVYAVSPEFTSPYPFRGGVLEQVTLDVNGEGPQHHPDVAMDIAFTQD